MAHSAGSPPSRCAPPHHLTPSTQSQWTYHPGGTRFEDRVGAILSRGVDLQQTFKQQALLTAKKVRVALPRFLSFSISRS